MLEHVLDLLFCLFELNWTEIIDWPMNGWSIILHFNLELMTHLYWWQSWWDTRGENVFVLPQNSLNLLWNAFVIGFLHVTPYCQFLLYNRHNILLFVLDHLNKHDIRFIHVPPTKPTSHLLCTAQVDHLNARLDLPSTHD